MFSELLDKLTMMTLRTLGLSLDYANVTGANVDKYSYGCEGGYCSGACGGTCEGGCDSTCYGRCADGCAGYSSNS